MTTKDEQIPLLFPGEAPYVAPWLRKTAQGFDAGRAEKARAAGMRAAASSHQLLLAVLRRELIRIAEGRVTRSVTADDAQAWLLERGYPTTALGNAAGSLFRGGTWVCVGYKPSERVSRHRNRIAVWQLKEQK